MFNVQNVKINGKIYKLPTKPLSEDKTYSGFVYRMQVEDSDMAVKIYRTEKYYEDEEQNDWFPPQKEMEKFIELSDKVRPVLLSNAMVLDERNHYIGCSSYYIDETSGNTLDAIFDLSCSKFFSDIFAIKEQIPIISKNYIELDDWNCYNLKYGTISKDSDIERIYCFDDSNYRLSDESVRTITNSNYSCLNHLAEDMLYVYLCNNFPKEVAQEAYVKFLTVIRHYDNYFEFMEKESRAYSNMNEFLKDRVKRYPGKN